MMTAMAGEHFAPEVRGLKPFWSKAADVFGLASTLRWVLNPNGLQTGLLRVLERPEVPLHNNGTERDIREYVKKRKISGGTRSAAGRRCRDTFTSLKKTCRKLGVNFWNYLQDRLRGLGKIPRLAELIRERAAMSRAPRDEAVPA